MRALMVVMAARERSRDVSKQTVDATRPAGVISSVATWAGDLRHDTRVVHSGIYPSSVHPCQTLGLTDVGPLSPSFRATAVAVEIYAQCYSDRLDSYSSGHNFACQRHRLPKLPRVCRLARMLAGADRDGELCSAAAADTGNQSVIGRSGHDGNFRRVSAFSL